MEVQSTNPTADCYLPPMCSTSAPFGYLGTIVPLQSTDPNADCYIAPMCRDQVPSGYLGPIIQVQSTDPGGDCYLPPVCEPPPQPGYLGQIIPVQSTDPNGKCYVCPVNTVEDVSGECVPCLAGDTPCTRPPSCTDDDSCYLPPPLCANVAPPDYLGTIIPMQSTDRYAVCFVTADSMCADDAPTGYLGTIIPMQITDPDGLCYPDVPPVPSTCTNVMDRAVLSLKHDRPFVYTTGSSAAGLSFNYVEKIISHAFAFKFDWPGHSGEVVNVGVEYTDANGGYSLVHHPHIVGEGGWNFSSGSPLGTDSFNQTNRFVGPWISNAYDNKVVIWVNTHEGQACFYYYLKENYPSRTDWRDPVLFPRLCAGADNNYSSDTFLYHGRTRVPFTSVQSSDPNEACYVTPDISNLTRCTIWDSYVHPRGLPLTNYWHKNFELSSIPGLTFQHYHSAGDAMYFTINGPPGLRLRVGYEYRDGANRHHTDSVDHVVGDRGISFVSGLQANGDRYYSETADSSSSRENGRPVQFSGRKTRMTITHATISIMWITVEPWIASTCWPTIRVTLTIA